LLKNNEKYIDIVLLLRKTTKIESTLESLGGEGGGIWDKADSINNIFPFEFMQNIIDIAKVRNNAVHSTLKVENIEKIVQECDAVLEILEHRKMLNILEEKIKLKLNEFQFYHENNKIILEKSMNIWIRKLNAYDFNTFYNAEEVNQLLLEGDSKISDLNVYAKKYVVSKRLSQVPYFILLSSIVLIGYIFFIKELI